jgi:deoxyribonuclease-4
VVDAGDWTKDRAPLGAHVSVAGGTWESAARAREISATGSQIFTKQANRWLERDIDDVESSRYRTAMMETNVRWTCAHDSYLINLASPDDALRARSLESFRAELRRCHALGLDALVSHPGNFMDDRANGIARNAEAITAALEAEVGPTRLLMELTAGQGTVLGSTFEEMADLLSRIPAALRRRVGVETLGCLHLNDSKAKLGSHLDRHELIAEGTIGDQAFRRIMTDERMATTPKVIETPKGDTPAETDGRMLRLLRSYAAG